VPSLAVNSVDHVDWPRHSLKSTAVPARDRFATLAPLVNVWSAWDQNQSDPGDSPSIFAVQRIERAPGSRRHGSNYRLANARFGRAIEPAALLVKIRNPKDMEIGKLSTPHDVQKPLMASHTKTA
jgi:hypothetical protein